MRLSTRALLSAALMAFRLISQCPNVGAESQTILDAKKAFEQKNWLMADKLLRQALKETSPDNVFRLSDINLSLGLELSNRVLPGEAEPFLREALRLYESLPETDPFTHVNYILALTNCCRDLDKHADAVAFYRQAEKVLRAAPESKKRDLCLGQVLMYMSMDWSRVGDNSKAVAYGNEALKFVRLADDPGWIAMTLNNLGVWQTRTGDFKAADENLHAALEMRGQQGGGVGSAHVLNGLGELRAQEHKYDEALDFYQQALDLNKKNLPPDHPFIANSLRAISQLYRSKGDQKRADEYLELATQTVSDLKDYSVAANRELAINCLNRGEYSKAETLFKTANQQEQVTYGAGGLYDTNKLRELTLAMSREQFSQLISKQDALITEKLRGTKTLDKIHDAWNKNNWQCLEQLIAQRLAEPHVSVDKTEKLICEYLLAVDACEQKRFNVALQHCSALTASLKDDDSKTRDYVSNLLEASILRLMQHAPTVCVYDVLDKLCESRKDVLAARTELEIAMAFETVQGPGNIWTKRAFEQLKKEIAGTTSTVPKSDSEELIPVVVLCAAALADGNLNDDAAYFATHGADLIKSAKLLSIKDKARLLFELADVSRLSGRFAVADGCVEQVLSLSSSSKSLLASCDVKFAQIALDEQDLETATHMATDALTLLKTSESPNNEETVAMSIKAQALMLSADAESETKRKEKLLESLSLFKQTLETQKLNKSLEPKSIVKSLIQQSMIHMDLGDTKEAEQSLNEAKTSSLSFHDPEGRALLGDCYAGLGELELRRQNFGDAEGDFLRAAESHSKDNSARGQIAYAIDLNAMSCILMKQGDEKNAVGKAIQAATIIDAYVRDAFPQLSFAEQRAFLRDLKAQVQSIVSIAFASPSNATVIYEYLMKWRGLLVASISQSAQLSMIAKDPQMSRKYDSDLRHLAQLQNSLSLLAGRGADDAAAQADSRKWTQEKESLQRELSVRLATDGRSFDDKLSGLKFSEFQKSIAPNEILADFYTFMPVNDNPKNELHYGAFLLRERDAVSLIDFGATEKIKVAIKNWRMEQGGSLRTLGKLNGQSISERKASDAKKEVAELVWSKLENVMGASNNLIICDDGELAKLPWSSMPLLYDSKSAGAIAVMDSPREWLGLRSVRRETYGIGVQISKVNNRIQVSGLLPPGSAQDAGVKVGDIIQKVDGLATDNLSVDQVSAKIRSENSGGKVELTILRGDEKLSISVQRRSIGTKLFIAHEPVNREKDASSNMLVVGGVKYKDSKLYLKGTEQEAKDVQKEADGFLNVIPLTGASATDDAILKELPNIRVAHLATHGFFDATSDEVESPAAKFRSVRRSFGAASGMVAIRNPLVESGLLFAPSALKDGKAFSVLPSQGRSKRVELNGDDGKVSAEQLVGVNLQKCELIVLSACDTGRGEEEVGQGVLGLRSAIMAAGSRSILLSLWRVDDQATCALMKSFYHHWLTDKESKAQALKHAQLDVREKYPSPHYWAAWCLVGDVW